MFENIAAGATGAGGISGFRGALFVGNVSRPMPPIDQLTMSPYATTPNPLTRKKKPMKLKNVSIKENQDFDVVTTSALRDLLRSKQRDSELRDTTEVFALEDSDGAIVKVYVKKDQAEDFKRAIETALADEDDQKEIAEILFDLHKGFEIVSVDWGNGSIPEDEEVSNSVDAEEQGFPDNDSLGDVGAEEQGTADEASAINGGIEGDLSGDAGMSPDIDGQVDQTKMLTQIIGLLQSQADAQRAQADAAKAKADVDAAEAAGRAAAQYSSYQEEVMDMDNYNKRQQEDRRENQIQAKLIRYRHDLRKEKGRSLDDKLEDPEYLLNTLHKASIGESVNITPPTPEEEEVLHMEDWEKTEKEKKHSDQLRDRMLRYKHARNKAAQTEQAPAAPQQESQATQPEAEEPQFDPKSGSLMDYLLRSKAAAGANQ